MRVARRAERRVSEAGRGKGRRKPGLEKGTYAKQAVKGLAKANIFSGHALCLCISLNSPTGKFLLHTLNKTLVAKNSPCLSLLSLYSCGTFFSLVHVPPAR